MHVSSTDIISPPHADGHNKKNEEIQMLRSLLNATTALTIVVSQATTPATALAVTGATMFAVAQASAQDMREAKQRLDQARQNFERARATGEGVEEARQELDAARAAMAGAIGERRADRREQADNRPQQRQKQQDAAENARPEPAQDAQGERRATENSENRPERAERPERPEKPVEQAAPAPEPKGPSIAARVTGWLAQNWFYAIAAVSLALAGIFLVQYGVETGLLTLLATVFATGLGALIALPVADLALKLPAGDLWWVGALVAGGVSSLALLGGLLPTLRAMRLNPAVLLREG